MRITYLYHSGFAVEMEKHVLLFDYYKGEIPDFPSEKKIYVFVSHKHQDHFSFQIFDLIKKYGDIKIFLGSDIRLSNKYLQRNGVDPAVKALISNVGAHRSFEDSDIKITTLQSTDAGVAFVVECENKRFYHAGDLNDWHWNGESEKFNIDMQKAYRKEIDSIAGQHFDVAFVPLDPRLETAYGYGMDYFLENTETDYVFPMHMWDEYQIVAQYRKTETGRKYSEAIQDVRDNGKWEIN